MACVGMIKTGVQLKMKDIVIFFILTLITIIYNSDIATASNKRSYRSGAPELGPYLKSDNDPRWYQGNSISPGRWINGIAKDDPNEMILGSDYADDAYYPWGYSAPYIRRGKVCVSNQFATNGLGELVLYEKVRPIIYCNYR